MATRCKIRKGCGSAQFAEGEAVYVRMAPDDLRREIERARHPEESGDASQQIWVMEDPITERGCYTFVADLEMPRGKKRMRGPRVEPIEDHDDTCDYVHGVGPCDCWQAK